MHRRTFFKFLAATPLVALVPSWAKKTGLDHLEGKTVEVIPPLERSIPPIGEKFYVQTLVSELTDETRAHAREVERFAFSRTEREKGIVLGERVAHDFQHESGDWSIVTVAEVVGYA